jgi:LmbE family N-acetylglucosaminyl deacetylase
VEAAVATDVRLSCVFAHPDDETFSVGGALARYAADGIGTSLYCATDGDAGRSSGVPVSSRTELARLRRDELLAASRVLGICDVEFGGHGDGVLAQADTARLIGEIVAFIRRMRPAVVVTFGPEGAPNTHRDHKAISRAATAAFFLAGLPTEYPEQLVDGIEPHAPSRLYYVAWAPPPPGAELGAWSVPPTAAVDIAQWHEPKLAAFMAHTTQRDHLERFITLGLTPVERFALAAGMPQPEAMTDDLFKGL